MNTEIEIELRQPFELDHAPFEYEEVENDPLPSKEDVSRNDLGYFMNLAGRHQLLSAAEERDLGLGLWRERKRVLRLLRRVRKPWLETEVELTDQPVTTSTRRRLARAETRARALRRKPTELARALAEIDAMRARLVEANLRLVVWVSKSFRGRGFDFIDLIQEGSLGLLRAVDRYDPRVGARFSTFATHWIRQGIRRALAEKARLIRIPVNRIADVRQTLYLRKDLSRKLGRTALPEEIATEMGVPKEKVTELLPAIGPIDSIDALIPSTDRFLAEILEDRSRPTPLEVAQKAEMRQAVKAVLRELPDRQRIILSMRHGIGYPRECTLDEIAQVLGLSRERIRQVEKVAAASVRDVIRTTRPALAEPV